MFKKEIRRIYKAKRLALHNTTCIMYDLQILEHIKSILPQKPITLLTYAPLEKWNEPDVSLITKYLEENELLAALAFPKITEDNSSFNAISVDQETDFSLHNFDINEPKNGAIMDPKAIDIALIPLLAFDTNGYRVGYGKGMYDKYLQHCSADIVKIGISYFSPIEKITDSDTYDIPLDYCITPEKCYKFGPTH